MATDEAFVGRMYLERAPAGSPQVYTRICEVFSISGVGETNDQVDATTFCSGGNREFIAGLAEGSEVTVEANYIVGSAGIADLITDVKQKSVISFRVVADPDGDGDTDEAFYFDAAALSWVLNPSVDNRNTITFGLKITGAVDVRAL